MVREFFCAFLYLNYSIYIQRVKGTQDRNCTLNITNDVFSAITGLINIDSALLYKNYRI